MRTLLLGLHGKYGEIHEHRRHYRPGKPVFAFLYRFYSPTFFRCGNHYLRSLLRLSESSLRPARKAASSALSLYILRMNVS